MRWMAAAAVLMVASCLEASDKFDGGTTMMPPDGTTTTTGSPPPPTMASEPEETTNPPPPTTGEAGESSTSGTPMTTGMTTGMTGMTGMTTMMTTNMTTLPDPDGDTEFPPLPVCGDGQVDPGEACDDGNASDSDGCLSDCTEAFCGDGVWWSDEGKEECDDGDADEQDDCLPTCELAECGDGIVFAGVELCDDGNDNDDDGCKNDCTPPPLLVFVTSAKFKGNLGGLGGADSKCQTAANNVGIPGKFMAWLSDNTLSAGDRIFHADVPYVRRDGKLLAENWVGLTDAALDNAILLNEFGEPSLNNDGICGPFSSAFTNTKFDGTTTDSNFDCKSWSTTVGPSAFGRPGLNTAAWSADCMIMTGCSKSASLYCVQVPM